MYFATVRYPDAQHFQFTVDSGRAPSNVFSGHCSDQSAHIGINSRATTGIWSGFPGPVQSEALSVPPEQGIWLEDHQCLYTSGPHSVKPDPENSLALTKTESFPVTISNQ